jgi:hypothetical protein
MDLMDLLVPVVNFLIDLLNFIVGGLISLLPQTPFDFKPLNWGPLGQAIGYFIPVGSFVTHLTLILTAVGFWYVVRWAMRIIRMIQ